MPVISYGGLLVGSTQGSESAVGEWIRVNIKPQEVFPAARLQWPGYLSGGPLFEQTAYPWDHVEIDRLYWPWGASRFAHAHVVVDDVTLAKIRLLAYANQRFQALDFVMDDGQYSTTSITTKLWMLPARPLSTAAPGGNALYLLSLVDDRYFWWETSLQYSVTAGVTLWSDLYSAIGSALGTGVNADTINSAYGTPTVDYAASYRQLPIVFDAMAWSVGQRVVRKLDGTVITQNAATAIANQTAQAVAWAGRKRRGGLFDLDKNQANDLPALVPASLKVVYSATGTSAPAAGYPSSTSLSALNLSQYPQPQISGQPWTKVLHRYEIATYSGGANPTNKTTLDAVTAQFANDWYLWQLASLDRWHVGTVPWTLDGLNDVEWRGVPGEVLTHVRRCVFNPQEDLIVPAPVVKGSDCAKLRRVRCSGGVEIQEESTDCGTTWVNPTYVAGPWWKTDCEAGHIVVLESTDCGATYTTIALDTGAPCGDEIPCRTLFKPRETWVPGPCIPTGNCGTTDCPIGVQYWYVTVEQLKYDDLGCLRQLISGPTLTPWGCCLVCSTTHDSGTDCPGVPCGYCAVPATTPCQWTFPLTCPDFGGGGFPLGCVACGLGGTVTPTSWTFNSASFINLFSSLAGAKSLPRTNTCEWFWGDPLAANYTLTVTFNPFNNTVQISLRLYTGADEVGYNLIIAGDTINCCVPRTLTKIQWTDAGGTDCPDTLVITPVCGDPPGACTPDPSGNWTLTQTATQPCAWVQQKSGVTAVINLLYDPVFGQFEIQLVLTSATYVMVFIYLSPLGLTTFDCTASYDLALVSQENCICSDDPLLLTITPVASSSACCAQTGDLCCGCPASPATWILPVAGITAGSCANCVNYNGTFTLSLVGPCTWRSPLFAGCDVPDPPLGNWELSCDDTDWILTPGDFITGEISLRYIKSVTTWNCTGANVMTKDGDLAQCNNWPATVTVTPG